MAAIKPNRLITDDWEVTQKPIEFKPDFREPIEIEIDRFVPFFGENEKQEFVNFINKEAKFKRHQKSVYQFDEEHLMYGQYSNARIIKEKVWVTFTPLKIAGLWVSLASNTFEKYNGNKETRDNE